MKFNLFKIGKKSKKAFETKLNTKIKNKVLIDFYKLIQKNKNFIIKGNKKDIELALKKKIRSNLIERLILDEKKITQIINSIKKIVQLRDPTNLTLENVSHLKK